MPNERALPPTLPLRRIFWFWLPLAAMWVIMAAEQPSIVAAVSRLPEDTRNLAAFGLTFSLSLIIESPVIMLLTAGTALATDRHAYERLLRFTVVMAVLLTALHLLLALTPLYAFVLGELIKAPAEVIELSRIAFLLMTPWTAMIALRRLWEGVMIRYEQPQRVTLVIVARLAATVAVLAAGLGLGRWPGAYVGGAALSVGVTVGALVAWLLVRPTLRAALPEASAAQPLSWRRLWNFYAPLALTSLITMVSQPILSLGLARAPLPLESLAIWPVVMSFIFIGRSPGIAFQEVAVALLEKPGAHAALRRFAWGLALSTSGLFLLLALTPGAALWYRHASALEPALVRLAIGPTLLLAWVPGLTAIISWQRGRLVHAKETGPISVAVALNMTVLLLVVVLGSVLALLPGAMLAALALTLSLLVESLFLARTQRRAAQPLPETPLPPVAA